MAGSFSCFWDGQQKKLKSQSQGPRENAGRCGQETDTEHVCGQGRQREGCERFRIRQTTQSHRESGITVKEQRDSESSHTIQTQTGECYRKRRRSLEGDIQTTLDSLGRREVRRRLPWGSWEEGHREERRPGGSPPPPPGCCRLPGPQGAHSEGLCGLPHRAGRAAPAVRGLGAPWPRTALPECGRAAPSRPGARRGLGRPPPRCRSPGS